MPIRKETVYIAGAVTGLDINGVKKQFEQQERRFRSDGYDVFNPVRLVQEHGLENESWDTIMKFLIPYVCKADMLFIMSGWENSKGTNVERDLCRSIGIEIRYAR